MALLEYIKDQLLFKDIVTLPGLGSFEIRKIASRIQGKKIIPPTVQVIFNTERSLDDGSLATSIASAEEITREEAEQKVLEYIDDILFALNKGEKYVFEGFGILSRDSENVFRFEKDPSYQIEFESYGLESFELDPIEDNLLEGEKHKTETGNTPSESDESFTGSMSKIGAKTSSKTGDKGKELKNNAGTGMTVEAGHELTPPKENKNSRSIFWILTGAVIVILVSFIIIRMSTSLLDGNGLTIFYNEKSDKTAIIPEDENWDIDSKLNGDLGTAIDSMTIQENALTIQESSEPLEVAVVAESDYREFHIIAGSFKDKLNAGELQQQLTEKGYPALVIRQGEQLYRVSAMSLKTKEQGLLELNRFKQKTKNNAAWLLRLEQTNQEK